MAVTVFRTDGFKTSFPNATGWGVDEGCLVIYKDGTAVAVTAPGQWVLASVGEELPEQ